MARGRTAQLLALERFGGLNLRDQPDLVGKGEALSGYNFVLTDRFKPARRPNWAKAFTVGAGSGDVQSFRRAHDGKLALTCRSEVSVRDSAGAVTANMAATGLGGTAVPFNSPAGSTTQFYQQQRAPIRYAAGAMSLPSHTIVAPDGTTTTGQGPFANVAALWPGEQRMVVGGFPDAPGPYGPGGAATTHDHVWIGEPGDAERWRSDAFLRYSPGDQEKITAIVAWRDLVFIFKQSQYWVLRNVSVDSHGVPTYNATAVSAKVGALGQYAACAGRDGVYFASRDGIYRTRGGEPELVSSAMAPLFTADLPPFWLEGAAFYPSLMPHTQLAWHGERLYVLCHVIPPGYSYIYAAKRTFVYDPRYDWWSMWYQPGTVDLLTQDTALGVYDFPDQSGVVFGEQLAYASSRDVYRQGSWVEEGHDSMWLGGFEDFGSQLIKRTNGLALWGSGDVSVNILSDYAYNSPIPLQSAHFGTNAIDEGVFLRKGARGTRFAIQLVGFGKPWSVVRAVHHVVGSRRPVPVDPTP